MTTIKQASQSIEDQSALLARQLLRALGQDGNKPGLALTAKVYKAYLKGASCVDTTAGELSTLPSGLVLEACSSSHQSLGTTPLVHYQGKIYLHKTNALEHQLAEHLIWIKNRSEFFGGNLGIDEKAVDTARDSAKAKFKPGPTQTKAAINFGMHGMLLLTGGPGTGKTTTASLMVRLAVDHAQLNLSQLRLCAPTGRAKSKLNLSVRDSDYVRDLRKSEIPPAQTVQKYVANPDMLAHAKMIIVDECSMVDLGNFTKLLHIIREQCPDARLVLMGDHEQLPSVDTGSVYYDLCSAACLDSCKSRLGDNYRLQAQPLEWAKYVHHDAGAKDLSDQLKSPDAKAIIEMAEPIFKNCIKLALQGDDAKALEQIDQLRILCSHKSGKIGVRTLNREIRKALSLTTEDAPGSLVIVTQNDHLVTGLSNGDVGIVLKNKRVCFPRTKESDVKDASRHMVVGFNQLPPHEPAFATTIHKSQGSEYKHVIVAISSNDDNEGLEEEAGFINRKLVFTGITRAIDRLDVFAKKKDFEKAIEDIFARASGLQERLDEMSKPPSAGK